MNAEYRPTGLNRDYFMYIALCEQKNALKIGISSDPQKRMSGLRNAWKDPAILLDSFSSYHFVERRLHASLSPFRIRGEWYRNEADVLRAFAFAKEGRLDELGPVDEAYMRTRNPNP